jgi:hypothetical protein
MFVLMPTLKRFNRFNKLMWARPPATMVAKTASLVIGGRQYDNDTNQEQIK